MARRNQTPEEMARLHAFNTKCQPELVIYWACKGLGFKEIARKLGCAPRTVRSVRSKLMKKHGLKNAAQTGAWARDMGIADPVVTRSQA